MSTFRKATEVDIPAITAIYDHTHDLEERGETTIGWIRGVYPTEETAREALDADDLFVMEEDGAVWLPAVGAHPQGTLLSTLLCDALRGTLMEGRSAASAMRGVTQALDAAR